MEVERGVDGNLGQTYGDKRNITLHELLRKKWKKEKKWSDEKCNEEFTRNFNQARSQAMEEMFMVELVRLSGMQDLVRRIVKMLKYASI